MIAVDFSNELRSLLEEFGISPEMVVTTVNNRDRGVLDPGISRLIAVHWFSATEAVLVDSTITHKHVEGNQFRIERVRVMLAIKIGSVLPSGRVSQESELEAIMSTVAESFGHPVSFHQSAMPVALYSGPWDGQPVRISDVEERQEILVLATLNAAERTAFSGWAFNLQRYLSWRRGHRPAAKSGRQQEVVVSGLFTQEFSKRFGIRSKHALEVVESPDKTDTLEMDGLVLRIHSKYIDKARPSFVLVVVESEREGKRSIDFALKAYPDLATGVEDMGPLAVLRLLAEKFGVLIKVGSTEARFIEKARIPIDHAEDIRLVESIENPRGSYIQGMYLRVDPGPPMIAHCALCLGLRVDEYERWLHTMN